MEYPSDFNTPAFPAGKSVAIARFMAIGSCVLFVLVLFMCAMLFWAARSQRIDPFIVSVDNFTGQWTVVGHTHGNGPIEYPVIQSLQESMLGNFTADWFTISDESENNAMWQTCERTEACKTDNTFAYGDKTCALFCASGQDLFSQFIYNVVPDYQERVANGEQWTVNKNKIYMEPVGRVSENGGTWRIKTTIQSNISGNIDVIAFAKVARNTSLYPQTLGYYVADFNAYKIN